MNENQDKQELEIHYYFNDDTHTMNAFVRNKAEKDLLEAIKRIGIILDNDTLNIETQAYQEGGLVEILGIVIPTLHYLSPSINTIISHHFTKNTKAEQLDLKIKEETLKKLQNENKKEIEQDIDKKLTDKLVAKYVSNFYKQIDSYEKVQKIGFKDITNTKKEYIVDKVYFKNFILIDDTVIDEDDDAVIEIISPVLKNSTDRWKGNYKNEKINFSMGDSNFKEEVIEGKHKFSNGFIIECHLKITTKFDEFGDEKNKTYSVQKVYGTKETDLDKLKLRESGKKKQRQQWIDKHQGTFNFEETTNDK